MKFFVAIEMPKDEETAYGVVVPDIDGCFSTGDTLEEALANVEEAIVMQLEDMIERKLEIAEPSSPESIAKQFKKGWVFYGVDVDPQQLSTKAKRINITVPEGALYLIDRAAKRENTNRSSFLYEAALSKIDSLSIHRLPEISSQKVIKVKGKAAYKSKPVKGGVLTAKAKPETKARVKPSRLFSFLTMEKGTNA